MGGFHGDIRNRKFDLMILKMSEEQSRLHGLELSRRTEPVFENPLKTRDAARPRRDFGGKGRRGAKRRSWAMAAILILINLGTGAAGAQEASFERLEYRPSIEVPLTIAGVAGSWLPRLLAGGSESWECRWCDRDENGVDTLNRLDAAARRNWRWTNREAADRLSHATVILSLIGPATALAATGNGIETGFADEMLIVAEAAALHMVLTQATKYLFRRDRPWSRFEDPLRGERLGSRRSVQSFVSGNASWAFAVAVSAGSIASIRGGEGAEWVWITGLTAAAATGYLRVAADQHYLTDVLAGALIGSVVGWVVPRVFDRLPEVQRADLRSTSAARVPAFSALVGKEAGLPVTPVVLSGGLHRQKPFVALRWSL